MHGIVVVGAPNLDSVINNLLAGDGTTGNVKRISKSLDKALDACIRTEARLRAALANLSAVKPTAEVALEKVIAAIRDNDDAHLIAYGCASTWDSFSHLNEARHRAERVVLSNRMASPGRGLVKLTLRKIELLARKLTWMSEAVGSLGRAEALAIMLAMLVRLLPTVTFEVEDKKPLETAPVKPERIPPPIPPPLDPSRQTLFLNAPNVA